MFGNLNQCGQNNSTLGPMPRLTELHGITGQSKIYLTLVVSCSVAQRGHEKEQPVLGTKQCTFCTVEKSQDGGQMLSTFPQGVTWSI